MFIITLDNLLFSRMTVLACLSFRPVIDLLDFLLLFISVLIPCHIFLIL